MRETRHTFQEHRPLFVRKPFDANGKSYKKGDLFPWYSDHLKLPLDKVETLYSAGFLHHDTNKEIESKGGDRLAEMNHTKLRTLREQLNLVVRKRTSSKQEYNKHCCKGSTLEDKQRALIRQFLSSNPYITTDEELIKSGQDFYSIRDYILSKGNHKEPEPEVTEEEVETTE